MVTSKIWGPWGPAITQRNKVTYCGCLNNAVPVDLISEAPPFPPPCVTLVPTSHFTFPVQLFVQLGSQSATVSIFYFWRISFHGPDLGHGHRNSHLAERRGWSRAARGSEGQGCQMHLTAEDKNSEEALSKGAFRGKMGLIIPKEVLETTATQMLGWSWAELQEKYVHLRHLKTWALLCRGVFVTLSVPSQLSFKVFAFCIWNIAWFTLKIAAV